MSSIYPDKYKIPTTTVSGFTYHAITNFTADLIHLPLAAILADDISNEWSWMKMVEFGFNFHWNVFLGVWSLVMDK